MPTNIKGSGRHFTQDEVEELIVKPYLAGKGMPEIARATNSTIQTVRRWLVRCEVQPRAVGVSLRRLAEVERRRKVIARSVIARYRKDVPLRDISREFHTSRESIQAILDAAQIPPRVVSREIFTPRQRAQMARAYERGESTTMLARRFGTNDRTIRRYLRQAGVQLRSRQEGRALALAQGRC